MVIVQVNHLSVNSTIVRYLITLPNTFLLKNDKIVI